MIFAIQQQHTSRSHRCVDVTLHENLHCTLAFEEVRSKDQLQFEQQQPPSTLNQHWTLLYDGCHLMPAPKAGPHALQDRDYSLIGGTTQPKEVFFST
jgi:hypothetical protein